MSKGTELIAAERERQVTEEGYTAEDDADHSTELAVAGAAYAASAAYSTLGPVGPDNVLSFEDVEWPWDKRFWKPTGDPVRDLTKAGALIAAAIDSLTQEAADAAEKSN